VGAKAALPKAEAEKSAAGTENHPAPGAGKLKPQEKSRG